MKIVKLTISPEHSWKEPSVSNPMRATVKMQDTNKTELSLQVPEEMMEPLIDLLSPLLVSAAKHQVGEFVNLATKGETLEIEAH